jgi:hypothetical protein
MGKWQEKLVFAALAVAFLIPISIMQNMIDDDKVSVAFLRWVDNQEAYARQSAQTFVTSSDERVAEEVALFNEVENVGLSMNEGFEGLAVGEKWPIIIAPDFDSLRGRFLELVLDSKITLSEGAIEWSNPDVSANVGALVLGFRKLVADMLWLRVDEFWHLGLASRMLPMMETVVTLDPHFIEAYALGAWHLAYNVAVTVHSTEEKMMYIDQGIGLLEKGIKNNPRSSKLYFEIGFTMYFVKLKDWEKSAYYLGEASKYEHEAMTERAYILALERMGKEEEAMAVLEDYDKRYPETYHAHEQSMKRIGKKLEAQHLEEEGKLREAYAIWRFLEEDDPSDVISPIEAMRLRNILGEPADAP